jgi:hypothetical protein
MTKQSHTDLPTIDASSLTDASGGHHRNPAGPKGGRGKGAPGPKGGKGAGPGPRR